MASRTRAFFAGAGLLRRGFGVWWSTPGLRLAGLLPGLITFALFAVGLGMLWSNLDTLGEWLASRVVDGGGVTHDLVGVLISLAILGGSVVLVVYTFTAVTLLIGQPFFERISERIDARLGAPAAPPEESRWTAWGRGLAEGLGLGLLTAALGLGLFLLGLVPVVGTVAAFTIGAVTGGWFLALELTSHTFSRRGFTRLAARRRALREIRPTTLGFGVAAFLLFLVPLGAVVTMPAAVAGATLLARTALGERADTAQVTPAGTS